MQDIIPGAPLRVLVLDASGDTPKWLIASVTIPSDVRSAAGPGRLFADWADVRRWVDGQVGRPVSLTPVAGMIWRIDEGQSS